MEKNSGWKRAFEETVAEQPGAFVEMNDNSNFMS